MQPTAISFLHGHSRHGASGYLRAMLYATLRRLLFTLPPEKAHYLVMNLLKRSGPLRPLLSRQYRFRHPALHRSVFGLDFPNPVGLGAGFDKNAAFLSELQLLGFGFVEIGTVTPRPQAGNEAPRLFRLPADGALINRMGFNNDGVEAIAGRLKTWRQQPSGKVPVPMLIGGNIGKNKDTPNEEAWQDYETCFTALHPYVDFFVVNVSSPNTPGLRELQEKASLRKILSHLQALNRQHPVARPLLLKIAPDLSREQLDDVLDLAREINLDGLVATNTTISRAGLQTPTAEVATIGAGGLSGQPLREKATDVLRYIHEQAPTLPVIGSGGIFTPADAGEKLEAGARLVEVWTGFIYEGPEIVKRICASLV